jgi:hypothetical protein
MAPYFAVHAYEAAVAATEERAAEAARAAARASRQMAVRRAADESLPGPDEDHAVVAAAAAEDRTLCELLRHVVGNPFRPPPFDPAWPRANGGAAAKIARVVYEDGRFDDLPFLADALEDAGCDSEELLRHCRDVPAGEHPLGCWVVDLLLRQE